MRIRIVPAILIVTAAVAGASLAASAQAAPQAAQTSPAPQQEAKPAVKKARKVWTDDDVKVFRSPEDNGVEEKRAHVDKAAATDQQAAAAKQASSAERGKKGAPPALSSPKSAEEADKMIAWEDRDIASQEEFVDGLRKRLLDAPPKDQERLRNLLKERMQILADARKEREALLQQKKELTQKPPAGGNVTESAQPPDR